MLMTLITLAYTHIQGSCSFHITNLVYQDFVLLHNFDIAILLHHLPLTIPLQPPLQMGIMFGLAHIDLVFYIGQPSIMVKLHFGHDTLLSGVDLVEPGDRYVGGG